VSGGVGGGSAHTPTDAGTPTILERILESTREEVGRRKRMLPLEQLEKQLESQLRESGREVSAGQRRLRGALAQPGIGVIAEFKRRSPSAGTMGESPDLRDMVNAYRRGGAVALSVLTEGPNFGGSLEDLRLARAGSDLPILRKDFIVDPYQVYEALLAGADAVLLIVAALEDSELCSLLILAHTLGLDALVEVHDRDELARALDTGAELIGVNNRDLRDFSVDVTRTSRLVKEIPATVTVVSESGISTTGQLRELQQVGVHGVLVGESLMRSADPEAALRTLTQFRDGESGL
jgi:indole-3-glycerol phosphate synthase